MNSEDGKPESPPPADMAAADGTPPSAEPPAGDMDVESSAPMAVAVEALAEDSEVGRKRKISAIEKAAIGVSRLDVKNQVGEGTFGDVFKAVYRDDGVPVAIKKIKMESEMQGFPITAIREIKILNVLKHENIVELKEVVSFTGEEDDAEDLKARCRFNVGDAFMVLEYVDYDLAGLMANRDVVLTPAHVQSYMKQLLTGVHYMHKNNILHRDLKGANILITRDNCLKIADWGLARSFINRSQRFSDKVVTLWYRSPELLLESRSYSSEVDMWSVGCIFGELLLGKIGLLPGAKEINQLEIIFQLCGTPTGETAEVLSKLDGWKKMQFEKTYPNTMGRKFASVDDTAVDLVQRILNMNPEKRFTAEESMDHLYFWKGEGTVPYQSLPKFTVKGGHEYEEKERQKEQINSNKRKQELQRMGGGGRWQAAGRGSIRLDPGKILSGRGRGELGTLGGARKFKITKGGAAAKAPSGDGHHGASGIPPPPPPSSADGGAN